MILGIGSEIIQAIVPNGRSFDPFDVLANIVGSLCAVGLCTWYHKRMAERRRSARFGSLFDGAGGGGSDDVELGVNNAGGADAGLGPQESGVTPVRTLEQEVDNWDENAVDDWEGGEDGNRANGPGGKGDDGRKPSTDGAGEDDIGDAKKRSD